MKDKYIKKLEEYIDILEKSIVFKFLYTGNLRSELNEIKTQINGTILDEVS